MSSDPKSDDSGGLAARVVDLEHKLAFQQRAFDELNAVVLEQQAEIENLRREQASLQQLLEELTNRDRNEDLPHEKPPHY